MYANNAVQFDSLWVAASDVHFLIPSTTYSISSFQ